MSKKNKEVKEVSIDTRDIDDLIDKLIIAMKHKGHKSCIKLAVKVLEGWKK